MRAASAHFPLLQTRVHVGEARLRTKSQEIAEKRVVSDGGLQRKCSDGTDNQTFMSISLRGGRAHDGLTAAVHCGSLLWQAKLDEIAATKSRMGSRMSGGLQTCRNGLQMRYEHGRTSGAAVAGDDPAHQTQAMQSISTSEFPGIPPAAAMVVRTPGSAPNRPRNTSFMPA